MSHFPAYLIGEETFLELLKSIEFGKVACVQPQGLQRNRQTLYRQWMIVDPKGGTVIFWDTCDLHGAEPHLVVVTVGPPRSHHDEEVSKHLHHAFKVSGATALHERPRTDNADQGDV